MTRVNAGIPVSQLPDKILLAEHREIKRLPNHLLKHGFSASKIKEVPKVFKLGKGHVYFFLWKGAYTQGRYIELHLECLIRGFNVQDYLSNWEIYNKFPLMFNDYFPTNAAIKELKARFKERGYKLLKPKKRLILDGRYTLKLK